MRIFPPPIGGEDTDGGTAVAVDKDGYIYVAGFTNSIGFYAINAIGGFLRGARDGFVVKMAPDASVLVYSTYLGDFGTESATSLAVDGAGNAYVTGFTTSSAFPVAAKRISDHPRRGAGRIHRQNKRRRRQDE